MSDGSIQIAYGHQEQITEQDALAKADMYRWTLEEMTGTPHKVVNHPLVGEIAEFAGSVTVEPFPECRTDAFIRNPATPVSGDFAKQCADSLSHIEKRDHIAVQAKRGVFSNSYQMMLERPSEDTFDILRECEALEDEWEKDQAYAQAMTEHGAPVSADDPVENDAICVNLRDLSDAGGIGF